MPRWPTLLAAAALVGYFLTGVHQVRPGERAVVRRFGRVLDEKPAPGLWIGLPWGVDRVDQVPVQLFRRLEVGYLPLAEDTRGTEENSPLATSSGQLLTGDHNLVSVRVAIDYAVATDDDEIVCYVLNRDRAEGFLARAAEQVLASWAACRRIDDLLIRGKAELPGILLRELQLRVQAYALGVRLQGASVVYLQPPEEVRAAFDDVTRAHAEVRTREEHALQAAARRVTAARTDRYTIEQQAETDAGSLRVQARAEAEVFRRRLSEYRRLREDNPDVLTGIWWDHMSRLLKDMREGGRVDLLDHHLGGDGLDLTVMPPLPEKKK